MQSEPQSQEVSSRRRLMVVEDDPRLRRAFAWALQDDFDVVQMSSVDEAVTALTSDANVELVLCDLILDGHMGVELFERLTEMHDPRAKRFVLMTAHDPARMRLPSVPVLLKPFTVAVLRKALADMFT